MNLKYSYLILLFVIIAGCKTKDKPDDQPDIPNVGFYINSISVNNINAASTVRNVSLSPIISINFSEIVNRNSVQNIIVKSLDGQIQAVNYSYKNNDSTLVIEFQKNLAFYKKYQIAIAKDVSNIKGTSLDASITKDFITKLDSTDKFARISESELLDKVQSQTLNYFINNSNPVSFMTRERDSSRDLVTTGGTGFGVMGLLAGVNRNFISRNDALFRLNGLTDFLQNKANRYHGAFPHWLSGTTGNTIAFSQNDNGADLVETAFLVQGLLCARQFFDRSDVSETKLRAKIDTICDAVEWNWFQKESKEKTLYWHWSPNKAWMMNMQVRGWNEALIVYVLAASSKNYSITKDVYDAGWARQGGMKNGASYFGKKLPLGPANGGPLFFSHYSFLGINPYGLKDAYANYEEQVINHTAINFEYCKANPKAFFGYSKDCWGLTASDIMNGYAASEPNNDLSVIAPTAALASFPFSPKESMDALNFFYYKIGDRLWSNNGFYDAFSLHNQWFANSTLAIDQGPIVVMIENHRSGLLWNLFTSCPEVKAGMRKLGFTAPYL